MYLLAIEVISEDFLEMYKFLFAKSIPLMAIEADHRHNLKKLCVTRTETSL
jgi:hypothetical protein